MLLLKVASVPSHFGRNLFPEFDLNVMVPIWDMLDRPASYGQNHWPCGRVSSRIPKISMLYAHGYGYDDAFLAITMLDALCVSGTRLVNQKLGMLLLKVPGHFGCGC